MTEPADPGFAADVRQAAQLWRGSPGVPLVYLLLGVTYLMLTLLQVEAPANCAHKALGRCPLPPSEAGRQAGMSFLFLPLVFFQIGLSGTARVWYARRLAGETLRGAEIWRMSWRFVGRFFLLGLLFVAVAMPFTITGLVLAAQRNDALPFLVGIAAGTITGDVLFTFATPGLALYNSNPWNAFTGGLKILRTTWPHCALYALVPPMALLLVSRAAPESLGKPLAAVFAFAAPLLTLLFAGASTAFVLRRWPAAGPEGSLLPQAPRRPAYADQGPPPSY